MTEKQEQALRALCGRYGVPFDPEKFKPALGLPEGYVTGWIGGNKLYVGCDPEGAIRSRYWSAVPLQRGGYWVWDCMRGWAVENAGAPGFYVYPTLESANATAQGLNRRESIRFHANLTP